MIKDIILGQSIHSADKIISHPIKLGNRHGLIAGATGTGKTVTLQKIIEDFSNAGVNCFVADVKGDLSGIAQYGTPNAKVSERLALMPWLNYTPTKNPVVFWDVFGKQGHCLRATITQIGPLLLTTLLDLTDAQQSVLYVTFKYADSNSLLIIDIKDLKAVIAHIEKDTNILGSDKALYNKTASQSLLRKISLLEQQGAEYFFGEPSLQIEDLLTPKDDKGIVHILDAAKLIHNSPKVYGTFLLWLLSELFDKLPERGDADKPIFAMFFDEAHLLFNGMPKPLENKLEQVVRLIRSKGVGVYFITQTPKDIPDNILAQLGLRIQHALRAFTTKEQTALKAVANGFVKNPEFDTLKTLTALGIGESLVSTMDEKGIPSMVEHVLIAPPQSRIGPLTDDERRATINASPIKNKYDFAFDRESAYEVLNELNKNTQVVNNKTTSTKQETGFLSQFGKIVARKATNRVATTIVRGILDTLMKK